MLRGLGLPRWWFHVVAAALLACSGPPLAGVELFDGTGNWNTAMTDLGFPMEGFDCINDSSQNLMLREGLELFLSKLVRVEDRGIVNIAIPCDSWIWLSRGRHKGLDLGGQSALLEGKQSPVKCVRRAKRSGGSWQRGTLPLGEGCSRPQLLAAAP